MRAKWQTTAAKPQDALDAINNPVIGPVMEIDLEKFLDQLTTIF